MRGIEHTGEWEFLDPGVGVYRDSLGVRWDARSVLSAWFASVDSNEENAARGSYYELTDVQANSVDELRNMIDRVADDGWTKKLQANKHSDTYTDENSVVWYLRPTEQKGKWYADTDLDPELPYAPAVSAPSAEDLLLKIRKYAASHRVKLPLAERPWARDYKAKRKRGGGAVVLLALFAIGGGKKKRRR